MSSCVPEFAPWRFMLTVDEVNYDLDEQADFLSRHPGTPIVNLASGVNFTDPPWDFVDFVLSAARNPMLWHDYDGPDGHLLARAAVATYEAARSGGRTRPGPENVIVTAGASAAVGLAARTLAAAGQARGRRPHAVLPAPTFPLVGAALRDSGFELTEVTSALPRRWLPTVDELTAGAGQDTTVLYVNTFNNPTGEFYPDDELRRLVAWARDHDVVILHDIVSSDLARDGDLPHLPSIAAEERYAEGVLTVGSLSKSRALPGFRVAWLIGDTATIRAAARVNELIAPSSPGLASPALVLDRLAMIDAERLEDGGFSARDTLLALLTPHARTFPGLVDFAARIVDEVRSTGVTASVGAWRTALRDVLATNEAVLRRDFGDLVGWFPRWRGDFNTLVRVPALDGRDYLETTHTLFRRFGLQTLPGPAFGHDPGWWRRRGYYTRLSFALPEPQWVRGLERLAAACDELTGGASGRHDRVPAGLSEPAGTSGEV
ncbi:pyridoxal phosphate-dependent aminotransferase [Actinophytocola xanthii]|uniref:Aminotransferase n=1 Tax=Actinophytocola xanthii TaxID=1912961 RepID=A0A1Q8CK16_9PSEU|nr:pyridoxal phosphate-dependent aminotransferase [Actinophytocola xanthii]OLF14694.1 hypothetical protein BU204_25730 [Actinophytocola xanthii]